MKFWNRKHKKKKDQQINESALFQEKEQGEHYVLDCCEQMVELLKELNEVKLEYQMVTAHLNDMQEIDQIPEEEREEINTVASEIVRLNNKRKEFQNSTNKIPEDQYRQMEKHEEEIPAAIRRLKENEVYLAAVKRDMNHLEGEKSAWDYERNYLIEEQKLLQKLLVVLSGLFLGVFVVAFILQSTYYMDMKFVYLGNCFVAVIGGFYIFLRNQRNSLKIQQAQINLNHAIVILNRIKTKYVNSANAVSYECEKYSVHNGHEFEYTWNQYLQMKEERRVYYKTSGELENNNQKLISILRTFRIKEPNVWIHQAIALVDPKEMVEIRHELIQQRQKLRTRIEYNSKILEKRKQEVSEFLKVNPSYQKEIEEILSSIDSLGGM